MEKIKIYVTERIESVLEKDAEGFEFFKSDGRTVNKNALLTKLIVNYHTNFTEQQTVLMNFLKNKMKSVSANEKTLNDLCFDLSEKLSGFDIVRGEKFDRMVSLKPTKESESVIEYIEEYCLMGRTLSEYFRSMFASYASLPQDKREQIIFKTQYDAIRQAIKDKKCVFVTTTRNENKRYELSPYDIATSKEEMHCYVLGFIWSCNPMRLSRIKSVTQIAKDARFSKKQIETFEKMKLFGPQFRYGLDDGEVLVELTQNGINKFGNIYVHRPIPTKVEGNRYYFECSHMQVVQYFERFGEDAKVIYPNSVREEIIDFHKRALEAYNE